LTHPNFFLGITIKNQRRKISFNKILRNMKKLSLTQIISRCWRKLPLLTCDYSKTNFWTIQRNTQPCMIKGYSGWPTKRRNDWIKRCQNFTLLIVQRYLLKDKGVKPEDINLMRKIFLKKSKMNLGELILIYWIPKLTTFNKRLLYKPFILKWKRNMKD
jgi:hypothetical protein